MEWEEIIKQVPILFDSLEKTNLVERKDVHASFPFKGGIYVFYEDNLPLYVGRTKRFISKRVLIHGRRCSRHNAASFAFLLAKEEAMKRGIDIGRNRSELEKDGEFRGVFFEQKKRIANMKVKVVQVSDSELQTVFEVYVSKRLRTKYNDFDTH